MFRRKLGLNFRVLAKLKDADLLYVARLIENDLQKTFSRYTDLSRNQMPIDFTSVLIPGLQRSPPREQPLGPSQAQEENLSIFGNQSDIFAQPIPTSSPMPRPAPAPQSVPTLNPTPISSPTPIVNAQPTINPQTTMYSQSTVKYQPTDYQPDMNPQPTMNPQPAPTIQPRTSLQPTPRPAPAISPQEINAIEKLDNLMKQMELKDQERKKKEEERRLAEAQFATSYGMMPMMNPMMNPIFNPQLMPMPYGGGMNPYNPMGNPMGYRANVSDGFTGMSGPSMAGPNMSQPMFTNTTGFQVLSSYKG